MYYVITAEDRIRVPPTKLGLPIEQAIKEAAAEQYERKVDSAMGMILSVISIDDIGEGVILPGDASVHYDCVIKLLVYKPELHELVDGEVIDNTEFGSFVRIGPFDGLVHISQLMDDYVSYDSKAAMFVGKESKKKLKEGDLVRARIISVSLRPAEKKIGLTMRQPLLGALGWIKEEKKRARKGV
jgi:DNA-directed RNA polymerase subunit E'